MAARSTINNALGNVLDIELFTEQHKSASCKSILSNKHIAEAVLGLPSEEIDRFYLFKKNYMISLLSREAKTNKLQRWEIGYKVLSKQGDFAEVAVYR